MLKNNFNIRSLTFHLIVMLIVLITVPLITLGIISVNKSHRTMEDSVMDELDRLTTNSVEQLALELKFTDLLVSSLSTDTTIVNMIQGNDDDKSLAQDFLKNKIEVGDGLIENLVIANTSTGLITESDLNLNVDLTDRAYFQEALTGTSSMSDVIMSKSTGNPVVAIASPVYSNNEVIGVIIASINFQKLTANIANIKVFDGGYGYMVNSNGIVLSHPVEDFVMNLDVHDMENEDIILMVEDIAAGKDGHRFYTYDGVYKYVDYKAINGWGVAITANYNDYMSSALQIRQTTITISIIATIIALIIGYLFIHFRILKPIHGLNQLMFNAGQGDLTVRSQIKTGDEIQSLSDQFNLMIDRQEQIVEQVRSGSKKLSKTSDAVSRSSMEVSSTTQEIAASITEVAHNNDVQNADVLEASQIMLQFSTLIELAKKTAVDASSSMNRSLEAAETGRSFVQDNALAIQNIANTSHETNDVLDELGSLSKQVGGIVESINQISSQTNLLALNAAIESARAGVHGQGFAVVAEQVRNLAEQASEEAEKIHSVIQRMVSLIDNATTRMQQGQVAVKEGVKISSQTDKAFLDILNEVQNTTKQILHIVEVTEEEVASSERIISVIDNVATLAENNALNAESVAAGAEEQASVVTEVADNTITLQKMATSLDELVNQFRTRGEANV